MAKTTYGIYGLSSFTLAPSAKCVAIEVDVEIKDLYTVIVKTDNPDQLDNVFVSGDFYSKNSLGLCTGPASAPSRQMNQIVNKDYSSVPDLRFNYQNIQQTIDTTKNEWTLLAFPKSDGSTTITYMLDLGFEDFIAGNAYKISIGLK